MKWFRGSPPPSEQSARIQPRASRRSSGMAELWRTLAREEGLCILDIGSTSPANISRLTGMGHKVYSEDLLIASTDPTLVTQDADGNRILDSRRFLSENLVYQNAQFDCVLCWSFADYMDESLVKPVVERMWSITKPGGSLLSFFHMKDAGPDAPCYRYHIAGNDSLEMQPIASHGRPVNFKLQRVFNNRHIEGLFRDFASIKFFLARDNIREVLVVR